MTYQTAHNGGKSVLNPNGLIFAGDYLPINKLKTAAPLAGPPPNISAIDANGYPTDTTHYGGIVYLEGAVKRPGNYILRATDKVGGGGVVQFTIADDGAGGGNDQGSSIVSATGCTWDGTGLKVFTGDGTGTIRVVINPGLANSTPNNVFNYSVSNGISMVALMHADDEADFLAGKLWSSPALGLINTWKPGVIRFLNWICNNQGNVYKWADQTPSKDYFTWGSYINPALAGTSITQSGNAYAANLAGATLVMGQHVTLSFPGAMAVSHITNITSSGSNTIVTTSAAHNLTAGQTAQLDSLQNSTHSVLNNTTQVITAVTTTTITFAFDSSAIGTYSNTADPSGDNAHIYQAPTFNLNGLGAKPLLDSFLNTLSYYGNTYVGAGGNYFATLTYDADMGAWILFGANVTGNQGLSSGCSFDVLFDLCATVGSHCWIVTPPYAAQDPAQDWVTGACNAFKAFKTANPSCSWMKLFFEGPNECWNFQQGYWRVKGPILGMHMDGSGNYYNDAMGMMMARIGKAVHDAFGGDTTQYEVIAGVQTAGDTTSANDEFNSPWFVAHSGWTAKTYVTALCLNTYFQSKYWNSTQEASWVTEYYTSGTTTARQAQILQSYVDGFSDPSFAWTPSRLQSTIANWKSWLSTNHSINKVFVYEGGCNNDNYGYSPQIFAFRHLVKNHPDLKYWCHQMIAAHESAGGTWPSCFQFSQRLPEAATYNDPWSVYDDIYQTPTPPQATAWIEYNSGLRRYRTKG